MGLIGNVLIPEKGTLTSFSENFSYIGATPFIFQKSLRDNLIYGNNLNISDDAIMDMLRRFDIFKEEINYNLDREIDNNSLSSGQMQKISFIRSLLANSDILLLDESTSNLDIGTKKFIFEILNNKKITIINSTHNHDDFEYINGQYKLKKNKKH